MVGKLIDIRDIFDQAMLKEANQPTLAQPVNIHGFAADKVNKRFLLLRRAIQPTTTTC